MSNDFCMDIDRDCTHIARMRSQQAMSDAALTDATNTIIKLRAELAALKAENEALRKDAARLDWVEHQDFDDLSFTVLVDQPNDGMTAVSIGEGWHLGNNLREAIDKAMEKPND